MIKLTGTTLNGRKFVILGLSEVNIVRLREKKPIIVTGEDIGLNNHDIWICWGDTESTLIHEFYELMNENTRVRDLRDEKKQ